MTAPTRPAIDVDVVVVADEPDRCDAHRPRPAPTRGALSAALLCTLFSTVLSTVLTACGVAGQPRPPGPLPPAAPGAITTTSTPDALLLTVEPPTTDIDGAPLDGPITLRAHPADDCHGALLGQGEGTIRLPIIDRSTAIRVVALRADRAGPPSPATLIAWTPPPPPPEAPLAFVDQGGAVQLSWLPPPPPIEQIEIHRDGAAIATASAAAALWSDPAPTGRHTYTLIGLAPGARTAASPPVAVEVP